MLRWTHKQQELQQSGHAPLGQQQQQPRRFSAAAASAVAELSRSRCCQLLKKSTIQCTLSVQRPPPSNEQRPETFDLWPNRHSIKGRTPQTAAPAECTAAPPRPLGHAPPHHAMPCRTTKRCPARTRVRSTPPSTGRHCRTAPTLLRSFMALAAPWPPPPPPTSPLLHALQLEPRFH